MWEQIRSNRTRSILLVALLAALLLLIGYVIGLLLFDNALGGLVAGVVLWAFMNVVAYTQADNILLSMARARKVSHDDYPQLYNIVEEMKIASGLPKMPDVYVIDDRAPNAFATGRDINHASVAVTTGLLDILDRDELQGVVAHEMSHIANRDVLLMAFASVLLGTIVILSWYATRFAFFGGLRGTRRGSQGASGQWIIAIIGLILLILAPIFAQLLYFAISRRREYLADASGALYTRYPDALASALEKLATSDTSVRSANPATAPMYTISPFRKRGIFPADWTSTHPPIQERVRILRAMAGGSSLADYNRAYRAVHPGGQGIIPNSALTGPDKRS